MRRSGDRSKKGHPRRGATGDAGGCADFPWREESQADRFGVLQTPEGTRALELAVIGGQGRGTRHRRSRQRQHDRADA
jgi:hypothetical protein